MGKQKIIIGSVVAVLLIASFVYVGLKNNIFADVNTSSYKSLKLDLKVKDLGSGDFTITANPATSADATLDKQTTYYKWSIKQRKVTGLADGKDVVANYVEVEPRRTSDPKINIEFTHPGIKYISMFASNGVNSQESRVSVAVKYDGTGSLPVVSSPSVYPSPIVAAKPISGNIKLPLKKTKISIFNGGLLSIPIGYGSDLMFSDAAKYGVVTSNPDYIEIDVPKSIVLRTQGTQTKSSETSDTSGGALAAGYHRYRLEKNVTDKQNPSKTAWFFDNYTTAIYLSFADSGSNSIVGKTGYKIRYKAYQSAAKGPWQEQSLTIASMPTDVELPKKLTTSFAWTNAKALFVNDSQLTDMDNFLVKYRQLGFNTVPNLNIQAQNPISGDRIIAQADRQSAKNSNWTGLKYGPEYGLFGAGYNAIGFFHAIRLNSLNALSGHKFTTKKDFDDYADGLDLATFNSTYKTKLIDSQFASEKNKWKKAIDFNIEAGMIDMAYDGILLQSDLNNLKVYIDKIQPEYLFIDAESFPETFAKWSGVVAKSQNAQDRKKAGESDSDLASRVIDEFTAGFTQVIKDANKVANPPLETKVGLYASSSVGNKGYAVFPWKILSDHKIVAQPSTYFVSRNLAEYAKFIRENRDALPKSEDINNPTPLIPYITTGTWGEMDAQYAFDEVVHTLLNGATGFSVFSNMNLDDMADILKISEAIKLITPYEDLITSGEVAFGDIADITNATVSAMKKDGQYLLAVTPKDKSKSVSFSIKTGKEDKYTRLDEKTKKSVSVKGPVIKVSEKLDSSAIYSLKLSSSTPSTPTPRASATKTAATVTPTITSTPTKTSVVSYSLLKGFSTLSVTKSSPTAPLTSVGLTIYKFDGANNKWLMTPTDTFTLTPLQSYYVYNPSTTKTVSLPTGPADTGPYVVTKGWNLLSVQSTKQRSQIQLNINKQTKSATDWITQKTINNKIFIIDNTTAKDSCPYFSLLDTTDTAANCSSNSLKKQKTIPTGKAFWVYVK